MQLNFTLMQMLFSNEYLTTTYGIKQKNNIQYNIHEDFNTHSKFLNILKTVCVSYLTKNI